MESIAPGKIIFTGEHAVVYGKPALVMAVNRFARTRVTANTLSNVSLVIRCDDSTTHLAYTFEDLSHIFHRLNLRYQRFLENTLGISEVMKNALELIPFAFYKVISEKDMELIEGVDIQVEIDIPLGCGMGSSAATALSVMKAVAWYYNIAIDQGEYYEYAMQCERLSHGTPSGVDPYISLNGGFIRFQNGKTESLPLPKNCFYLVLTGKPESSTGECVMSVKKQFARSKIWHEFENVATYLQNALKDNDVESIYNGIRRNHQLLTQINVVPEKVKNFIVDIEKQNGAGKISGAGSAKGDSAGIVLVFSESEPKNLCARYGYDLLQIESDNYGLRLH